MDIFNSNKRDILQQIIATLLYRYKNTKNF